MVTHLRITTNPMNVLFITRKYPPQIGGMEQKSYHMIATIRANKTVIALKRSQIHLVWFLPYATIMGIIKARHVDVVHIGDALLCGVGRCIHWFTKKPIIIDIHGLDVTYPNPLYQLYIKLFLKADRFVCNSKHTERTIKPFANDNTTIINPGVSITEFAQQLPKHAAHAHLQSTYNISIKPTAPVLITSGRLVKRKGVAWFIEHAFSQLPPTTTYIIIGDGPDRATIESLIRTHNHINRIFLLGKIPRKDLLAAYHAADLFVMPNVNIPGDAEGFGIVAIEAGAARLPIIATSTEGITDAITHNKNGHLVPPEQPNAFATACITYINNPKQAKHLGESAHTWNADHFSWDIIAKQYEELFRTIIADHANPQDHSS
jgi:glycosyltransferase involved in cell wall biosynthesis